MNIILASQSARRRELLEKRFSNLKVVSSSVEEKTDPNADPAVEVLSLSHQKCYDVAKDHPDALCIGSDTLVYLDYMIGKPKTKEDAFLMIKHLQGRTHKVYTGISLIHLNLGYKVVDYDVTEVTFKSVSDEEILDYLSRTDVFDKAGAYAIREEGHELVEDYKGELTTIIGFPMPLFEKMLKDYTTRNSLENI